MKVVRVDTIDEAARRVLVEAGMVCLSRRQNGGGFNLLCRDSDVGFVSSRLVLGNQKNYGGCVWFIIKTYSEEGIRQALEA